MSSNLGTKPHNPSIDILKCIAAIVITNSHMELLYGKYAALATGGAIGDVLFFFCSGFTLFLGRDGRFDNWYKRRVNRIYPTVFAWAMLSAFVFGKNKSMDEVVISGGGWFVSCIMLYYVMLYFVKRWMINQLKLVMAFVAIGCGIWFFMSDSPIGFNMYGNTYFKWFHYFIFMLMGATVGISKKELRVSARFDVIKLFACIVCFYAVFYLMKIPSVTKLHYFSLLPLIGVVWYFYKICNSKALLSLYEHSILGWLFKFIGGLCLEIYLVQYSLFTDKMNSIFPLNLLVMFVVIVLCAYILRCASRIFAQTFKDMDYDWRAVFRP